MEKWASITNLNWFEWSLFTLLVFLRWQALRKSSYDHICSEIRHATTIFLQFFVKKNVKNRLSASTTRGSIANIISYWYRVEENFMGFPTKKTACKSEQNSLQAWPICQGMYVHFCQLWPIFRGGGLFTMNLYHFATVDVKYWWVLKIMTKHFWHEFTKFYCLFSHWVKITKFWTKFLPLGITFILVLGRAKLGK